MALDSRQKRMSALNPACPWRGALVDAAESGFTQGNRQAAAYMYSGIEAESLAPATGQAFLAQSHVGTLEQSSQGAVHTGVGGFRRWVTELGRGRVEAFGW